MNKETEGSKAPPVEIPLRSLTDEALKGVVDEFILREGTDYGASEVPHAAKHEQLVKQLKKGEIKIVFDPEIESVTLMPKQVFLKLNRLI